MFINVVFEKKIIYILLWAAFNNLSGLSDEKKSIYQTLLAGC